MTSEEREEIYRQIKATAVAELEYEFRAPEPWAIAFVDQLFERSYQQGLLAGFHAATFPDQCSDYERTKKVVELLECCKNVVDRKTV